MVEVMMTTRSKMMTISRWFQMSFSALVGYVDEHRITSCRVHNCATVLLLLSTILMHVFYLKVYNIPATECCSDPLISTCVSFRKLKKLCADSQFLCVGSNAMFVTSRPSAVLWCLVWFLDLLSKLSYYRSPVCSVACFVVFLPKRRHH